MKKILSLFLVQALLVLDINAQTLTPKPGVQLAPNVAGYYEYLPKGYDGVKRFPLILFLHGLGNSVNQGAPLSSIAAKGNGLISMLADGSVPDQGMVVIAPQFIGWPAPEQSLQVINKAIELYSIDTTRIYVTGLSMGGGATWELAALAGKRIAAIAPICGASNPLASRIKSLIDAGMPIKAFHDQRDPVVPYSNSTGYVNGFNAGGGSPKATLYTYNDGSHNSWADAYLPYQGIYDFFRSCSRGVIDTAPTVPLPPSTLRVDVAGSFWNPLPDGNVSGGTNSSVDIIWGADRAIRPAPGYDQAIYKTARIAGGAGFLISYPVNNGNYVLRLHFCEFWRNWAGAGVFNVAVEGTTVLSNFDVWAASGGRYVGIYRDIPITVTDGNLLIRGLPVSGNAQISAFELFPSGQQPKTYTTTISIVDSATGKVLKQYTDTFAVPVKIDVK